MHYEIHSLGGRSSVARVGDHEIRFNIPGDEGTSPGPLGVFAAAAGACTFFFASRVLVNADIPTDRLRVTVDTTMSEERPKRIARLEIQVHMPEDMPADVRARVEKAVRACPVAATFERPPVVALSFTTA